VLGRLQPTRAFGDAACKWSRETQNRIKKHFFGRKPNLYLQTPPYVSAEPVVTSTTIEPSKGDFMVMATDGLWGMLTNEEVVDLVGRWIDQQNEASCRYSIMAWLTSWLRPSPTVKQRGYIDKAGRVENGKGAKAIRQQQCSVQNKKSDRFVVEDKNAATHLVRNAFGGADRDMVCGLLTLPSPYSRRYRDDLTVEVIFFSEGEDTRSVVVNWEATQGKG
jgi:pyruvate dehydrogenase phosphatase